MIEGFLDHYVGSEHEAWVQNQAADLFRACDLRWELPGFGGFPSVKVPTMNDTPLT